MSSLANDKRNVSVGDGSNNRDADTSPVQQESTSTSNDARQRSLMSVQNVDNTARAPENTTPVSGDVNINTLQSRFKALKVSCPPDLDDHGNREERQPNFQSNLLPHHGLVRGPVPQIVPQGMNDSHVVANQYFHGGGIPSTEIQHVLHSSGFAPPLYATAPYYAGAQPSGVIYPPQYGMGGYPYNANIIPSFLAGYPPYTSAPLAFDGVTTNSDVNTHVSGLFGGCTQEFDVQNINKVYGQFGFAPPFLDPRFHPSFGDPYSGNQAGGFEAQVRPDFSPVAPDHRPQHQGLGVQVIGQRRGGIVGSDHSGNSVNMGFYMQMPNSALPSPVLPGSPIGVNSFPGGRSDVSSPNSARSGGFYTGWHGQRGSDNVNYQKPYSFLEELKSGKGRRLDLSDITGHVVEFSVDQHGSRFIQQKLENCSVEDKASVFEEVVPHACKLMTDVFGNYVIQKFFEYGTPDQRRDLAKAVAGQILPLSLQMYGCRVIQKALDVVEVGQKIELVRELDGHVLRCVRDQNGNHVIQKCIECVPSEKIGFIISAFRGQIASLSMHPYGCRVIQRVLEHCTDELQSQFIVDEILESVCTLAQDQYGNYVTQHVLEKGKPRERTQIIKNLHGQVVKMSQHKFASNVVEKCLEYGDVPSRELLIAEVVGEIDGSDNLLVMMKDQYANYVVQKILEKCDESQRELLLGRVRVHIDALKKYTYGKHIVARFEQLFGEIEESTS